MTWDIYYKKLEKQLDAALGEIGSLRSDLEETEERLRALEARFDGLSDSKAKLDE